MTIDERSAGPAPGPGGGPGAGPAEPGREGSWRVGWRGVRTVAVLELRQRVRSTRWLILLALWVLALLALTLLIRHAVFSSLVPDVATDGGSGGTADRSAADLTAARRAAGATLFGIIVFLVLGLGGLVAPAFSATSINGDRAAGVLAALQTTLLTPAEIALGKLAAAWATALALLAAALPFLAWAYVDGGTPFGRLLVVVLVLALMVLMVCAIGLGWSAVAARTVSSTVLTYLSVVFLGLGLPIVFALTTPLVQQREVVRVNATSEDGQTCSVLQETRDQYHSERSWWLLGANPFVVVADSAPPARLPERSGTGDPLTAIRDGVRELRLGPAAVLDECYTEASQQNGAAAEHARQRSRDALPATWPYGLAIDLGIAVAFTVLAIRRLRAPSRRLPKGTRVA